MDKRTLDELLAWANHEEQRIIYGAGDYYLGYDSGRESVLDELRAKLNEMPVTK